MGPAACLFAARERAGCQQAQAAEGHPSACLPCLQERLADPAGNPARLVVDWVRVYQRAAPAAAAPDGG